MNSLRICKAACYLCDCFHRLCPQAAQTSEKKYSLFILLVLAIQDLPPEYLLYKRKPKTMHNRTRLVNYGMAPKMGLNIVGVLKTLKAD